MSAPMRLIDATPFEKRLENYARDSREEGSAAEAQVFEDVLCEFKDCPTVEAEPVRHAHWRKEEGYPDRCSACYSTRPYESTKRPDGLDGFAHWACPYCPACGAKMDEPADLNGRQ